MAVIDSMILAASQFATEHLLGPLVADDNSIRDGQLVLAVAAGSLTPCLIANHHCRA